MPTLTLFVGNDNLLEVKSLTNAATDASIDGATVTAQVRDLDGTVVGSTKITLSATTNAGEYRGTFSSTASLTPLERYEAVIEADGGSGLKGKWWVEAKARKRYQ